MPEVSRSDDTEVEDVTRLLELLSSDASAQELAAVPAPERARDLALRVATSRNASRTRETAQAALLDTARELASEQDPAIVLEAIVRRARTLLRADVAYLTLYDAEAGDTYMRVTDGSVSAAFQSLRLGLGDGLGGLVASTHKPYWTANYQVDERFDHTATIDSGVGEEGIIAICGTPLIVGNDFVGVLFVANRSLRPFSRGEVGLLGNLAALAAVTLIQTRALVEAQEALTALSQAHEVVRRQADGVERAAAAHDRFASLVLGGGGVGDITEAVGELLGCWAVLLDDAGQRRSAYGEVPALAGTTDPLRHHPAVEAARTDMGRLLEVDGVHAVGVTAQREQLGTLVVGGTAGLDDPDQRTVERAAVVTALVLLFERQADDARQAARNRVVADLLGARGGLEDRRGYLRNAGVDPDSPMCVLVVHGADPGRQRALSLSVSTTLGEGSVVGSHEDEIVAVVAGDDPGALARSLAGRLGRTPGITTGGAGPVSDVGSLPTRHEEASRAARTMVALGRAGDGAAASELGFAGLIVGADPDVSAYVRSVLGPVLDYDRERGTDLVGTLDAYFDAGSSPRHAATRLHLHVNTVAQRLDRVRSLLGEDWQAPQQALEVQLALRMRRLLGA